MSAQPGHRTVVRLAFSSYTCGLTLLIAILPAASVQEYPRPAWVAARSALAEEGRVIYLREGCGYCHPVRHETFRMRSAIRPGTVAADYANEDPPLPGSERTGPDLSNVAARQPSDTWHLLHLFNPRAVVPQSVMPGFPWYFEIKAAGAAGRCRGAGAPARRPG